MTTLEELKLNKELLKKFTDSKELSCDFETLSAKNVIKTNRYEGDPGLSDVYAWGMANDDYDFIWGTEISDFIETVFYLIENNKTHFIRKPGKKYAINWQPDKTFWFVNLPFDYSFMKNELYKVATRFDGEMNDFKDFCFEDKTRNAYMLTGAGQMIIQVKLFINGKFGNIKCIKKLTNLSVQKMGEEIGMDKLAPIGDEDAFYDAIDKVYDRKELYEKIYDKELYDYFPFKSGYGTSNNKYLNLMLPYLKNDCIIPLKYFNNKFRKMIDGLNVEFSENVNVKKVMNLKQAFTSSSMSINGLKNYNGRDQYKREFKNVLEIDEHYMVDKAYQGGLSSFNPINKDVKGKVIAIDINSSYPYEMMKELPYGIPLYEKPEGSSVEFINITIKSFKSKLNNQHIPLIKNSRISPTKPGDYRYVYEYNEEPYNTTYIKEELEKLEKYYDMDYKVEKRMWFRMKPYAKEYLHVLKYIKLNAENRDQKNASKIVLNSLYGKFGEKVHLLQKRSIDLNNKQAVKEELEFINSVCGYISHIDSYGAQIQMISVMKDNNLVELLKKKKPFSKHDWAGITFLRTDRTAFEYEYHRMITKDDIKTRHIGGYITWKAREHLINTIELFKWDDIVYYDTDSIYYLGDKVPDELKIDDKEFGAWSIDGEYEDMKVLGAKQYQLINEDGDVKVKCAGVYNAGKVFDNPDNHFVVGANLIGVSLKKIQLDNGIILSRQDHKIKGGKH